MSNLNWVDFIILAIFLFSIIAGFSRGFVREIVSLITLIAAFIIAIMFSNALAEMFTHSTAIQGLISQASTSSGIDAAKPVSYIALAISFGLLFAATIFVGSLLSYFLNIAFQTGVLGFGNRLLGGVFGFVRGFILNLVMIFIVQLTPLGDEGWWVESRFVNSYQPAVQWLGKIVSPTLANLKEKFGKALQDVGGQVRDLSNTYGNF